MEMTKLSTKGQIVIPELFRKEFQVGTPFVVSKRNNLIVLRAIEGLTSKEEKEIVELEKIWKEIDSGKGLTKSKDDFIKELENW